MRRTHPMTRQNEQSALRAGLDAYQAKYPAPFAVLGIRTSAEHVTRIDYLPAEAASLAPHTPLAERACRQIERYLEDPEYRFDLPFQYEGTAFQCRVWRVISCIAPGHTLTYAEIARRLKSAARPVGGACGANPIPLLVPCHRVLAAHGLGGFMHSRGHAALAIKRWLLAHEGVSVPA
jgi:methylated-DNA-[protein]-cysteine S-methyltransferase